MDSDIDSDWAGVDGRSRDQRIREVKVNSDLDESWVGCESDFDG